MAQNSPILDSEGAPNESAVLRSSGGAVLLEE